MYLINWNPSKSRIEANFGGCITKAEADVFLEELSEHLAKCHGQEFGFMLDFATVRRMDESVLDQFCSARDASQSAGAKKVVFVARDEREAVGLTESRLQQVIDGKEEYMPYRDVA